MNHPPERSENNDSDQNYRIPVHEADRAHWVCVWKAKEDVEEDDQRACDAIDHEAVFAHPEVAFRDVLTSSKDVWEYR